VEVEDVRLAAATEVWQAKEMVRAGAHRMAAQHDQQQPF